jgi:hypothetical protein
MGYHIRASLVGSAGRAMAHRPRIVGSNVRPAKDFVSQSDGCGLPAGNALRLAARLALLAPAPHPPCFGYALV